jgi:hypothetical protein
MTTKELIEVLSDKDPDAIVVLAADEEGNSYGELDITGIDTGFFDGDSLCDEEEYDGTARYKKAVVLYPY